MKQIRKTFIRLSDRPYVTLLKKINILLLNTNYSEFGIYLEQILLPNSLEYKISCIWLVSHISMFTWDQNMFSLGTK